MTWPDRKESTGRRTQNEANIKSSSVEYKDQAAKPPPQTPLPHKKRRGRPRKNREDTPLEKTVVAREARQDSQGAATDSQPGPEESCQVKDRAGDTSLYVMPPRVQVSYDALTPRGLAEFLQGDLHVNSLTTRSTNSQQSPSREDHGADGTLAGKYEPFDWHWDRPLPDLVTGEVLSRTGPLMQEDVSTVLRV
ncbi:hypothetical protein MPH_01468 [Macrophomina phaseolina MS6]|uniref:Uncharacterized protein n=1 Tax=Macrophomina phaseolina (strain MS6) TaxID=1126212 RepID=K2SXB6_MACPH|nr:hypothetical protein MPH_01468 [Macrophomina phaseolina MS6]